MIFKQGQKGPKGQKGKKGQERPTDAVTRPFSFVNPEKDLGASPEKDIGQGKTCHEIRQFPLARFSRLLFAPGFSRWVSDSSHFHT